MGIIKDLSVGYVLQAITIAISISFFSLISRKLTIEQFGIYSLLMVLINLLPSLANMGLTDFMVRDLAGKPKEYREKHFAILNQIYIYVMIPSITIISLLALYFIDKNLSPLLIIFFTLTTVGLYYTGVLNVYLKSNLQLVRSQINSFLIGDFWKVGVILFFISLFYLDKKIDSPLEIIFIIRTLGLAFVGTWIFLSIKKNGRKNEHNAITGRS